MVYFVLIKKKNNRKREKMEEIFYSRECQLVLKLLLIFVLSGFIGLERAALSKPAGFRTHVLDRKSVV